MEKWVDIGCGEVDGGTDGGSVEVEGGDGFGGGEGSVEAGGAESGSGCDEEGSEGGRRDVFVEDCFFA